MLKVNLKNTKIQSARGAAGEGKTGFTAGSSINMTGLSTALGGLKSADLLQSLDPSVLLKIVVKLLLILCFPAGLKVYETWQLAELGKEKGALETNLSARAQTRDKLKKEVKSFDYLTAQAKEYDQKKAFLKELANSRLIIPQLLDQVQSVIPESVWLKNLRVEIKDEGNLYIQGESLSEDRINLFADSLKNIVNKDSITLSTRDVKGGKQGFVKVSFDLKASLLKGRPL